MLLRAALPEQHRSEQPRHWSPHHSERFYVLLSRVMTVVWGLALVAEAFVRTALAFTISTQHFLEIAPVLGWGVIGALLWYTTMVTRAGEREADALAAPAPAD